MKSIGLCIIVRNEAHVIRRCLDSVRPLIDDALIVDTGSEDGTQATIRAFLSEAGMPGEVLEAPWRDFGWNRSVALERLREKPDIDYALMIDADEVLVFKPGFDAAEFKRGLDRDLYDVETRLTGSVYLRPQLFRNAPGFSFKGALHEYLECPEGASRGVVSGFYNRPIQDGARSLDKRKYLNDAAKLEAAIAAESDPFLLTRYRLYLAQSYRDGGERTKALENYLKRAENGGWDEEIYVSLWQAARMKEELGHPDEEIVAGYLKAYEARPTRAEALHDLMRYCRKMERHALGYLVGKLAVTIAAPASGLFIEPWVYEYGVWDEFAVAAYWMGRYGDSLDACLKILRDGKIPANERDRIERNADFAIAKLKS
jgi:glycosyltransferase involved in cell wall biosynthesis